MEKLNSFTKTYSDGTAYVTGEDLRHIKEKINEIVDAINDLQQGLVDGKIIGVTGKINLLLPMWQKLAAQQKVKELENNLGDEIKEYNSYEGTVKKPEEPGIKLWYAVFRAQEKETGKTRYETKFYALKSTDDPMRCTDTLFENEKDRYYIEIVESGYVGWTSNMEYKIKIEEE